MASLAADSKAVVLYNALRSEKVVLPNLHRAGPGDPTHYVAEACLFWSLGTGKIVNVIEKTGGADDEEGFAGAIEAYLASLADPASGTRVVHGAPFDFKAAVVAPGLVDLNACLFDVENGPESISKATKSAAAGGITCVVDLPRSDHGGFAARCDALGEHEKQVDVVPIANISEVYTGGDVVIDGVQVAGGGAAGGECPAAMGFFVPLAPCAAGTPTYTVEDVVEVATRADPRPLLVSSETYSSKALRLASPHRLLPFGTRYDPKYEIDHPTNMMGPISSSSSSNPGHAFGASVGNNHDSLKSEGDPAVPASDGCSDATRRDSSREMLVMSPMVTPLAQRQSIKVHEDWTSPPEPVRPRSLSQKSKNKFFGAILTSELESYKYTKKPSPARPATIQTKRLSINTAGSGRLSPLVLGTSGSERDGDGGRGSSSDDKQGASPFARTAELQTYRRPSSPLKFNYSPPKAAFMSQPSSLLARRNFKLPSKSPTSRAAKGGPSGLSIALGSPAGAGKAPGAETDGVGIKIYKMADPLTRAAIASNYEIYLGQRPPEIEIDPVRSLMGKLAERKGRVNRPVHVLSVSSAISLSILNVRSGPTTPFVSGGTCPHYLLYDTSHRLNACTLLKCSPPVRDAGNRRSLQSSVFSTSSSSPSFRSTIDSGHVEFDARLKLLHTGDLVRAVGGVNCLQAHAPAAWTSVRDGGGTLVDFVEKTAWGPAKILRLEDRKGSIAVGLDADFCIFLEGVATPSRDLPRTSPYRNSNTQVLSPMKGSPTPISLKGCVVATMLRGQIVYQSGQADARVQSSPAAGGGGVEGLHGSMLAKGGEGRTILATPQA